MSRKKHYEKTLEPITEARLALLSMLESMGSAAVLLRETLDCQQSGNINAAELCAGDVVDLMLGVEREASEIAAMLAKWVDATPHTEAVT